MAATALPSVSITMISIRVPIRLDGAVKVFQFHDDFAVRRRDPAIVRVMLFSVN